jgi:hypothetical protein
MGYADAGHCGDRSVHQLQLYLTPREGQELRTALDRLLADPEANEHEHVLAEDGGRELSLSIVTPTKLGALKGYTRVEQQLFNER